LRQDNPTIPTRALLLAGGMGSRLRPLTDSIPKCLVPIAGRPLLSYWFDILFQAGLKRALVNTHYRAQQVRDFCGRSAWRDRIDLVHEDNLLGTSGTLRQNRAYFDQGPFWFIHADNLSRFDPGMMWQRHLTRPSGCLGTMMTFETDSPSQCGIVSLDADGVIRSYHEKVADPPGRLANGAVFILEASIFSILDHFPKALDFCGEIVPTLVQQLFSFHNDQFHRDIGTPESYELACKEF
jgi:mannose-1-phosphate guanylyltransferase